MAPSLTALRTELASGTDAARTPSVMPQSDTAFLSALFYRVPSRIAPRARLVRHLNWLRPDARNWLRFPARSHLIGFDADDLNAYQERAKLYRRLSRHDDALADYSHCVRLGHIHAYLDRGEVYEKMGKFQEAIQEITNYVDRSEHVSYLTYQARARLFEKLGDAANANRDRMLAEQLIS